MAAGDFSTTEFFSYVRRRRQRMSTGGLALMVPGLLGLQLAARSLAVWFAGLTLLGVFLVAGAFAGAGMLRQARDLLGTRPREMELVTWPLKSSGRSLLNNHARVALDTPGSREPTPLAEFRAVWLPPGSIESTPRAARVFGTFEHRQTVFAITAEGSCYLGRIARTRDGDQ